MKRVSSQRNCERPWDELPRLEEVSILESSLNAPIATEAGVRHSSEDFEDKREKAAILSKLAHAFTALFAETSLPENPAKDASNRVQWVETCRQTVSP